MSQNPELDGTLRREWVKCGKAACKRCRGRGHGPYWYSYYRVEGRLRKTYIGAWLPNEYEHLLTDNHEPIAYSHGSSMYHKECVAALGYSGPEVDELLKLAGISKVHATFANRYWNRQNRCGQCGKTAK